MIKIKTDPTLLTEVRKFGQFDINACYQCGSCTVVCDLTNESASFPRRIVRYALMGLREPLQQPGAMVMLLLRRLLDNLSQANRARRSHDDAATFSHGTI